MHSLLGLGFWVPFFSFYCFLASVHTCTCIFTAYHSYMYISYIYVHVFVSVAGVSFAGGYSGVHSSRGTHQSGSRCCRVWRVLWLVVTGYHCLWTHLWRHPLYWWLYCRDIWQYHELWGDWTLCICILNTLEILNVKPCSINKQCNGTSKGLDWWGAPICTSCKRCPVC